MIMNDERGEKRYDRTIVSRDRIAERRNDMEKKKKVKEMKTIRRGAKYNCRSDNNHCKGCVSTYGETNYSTPIYNTGWHLFFSLRRSLESTTNAAVSHVIYDNKQIGEKY